MFLSTSWVKEMHPVPLYPLPHYSSISHHPSWRDLVWCWAVWEPQLWSVISECGQKACLSTMGYKLEVRDNIQVSTLRSLLRSLISVQVILPWDALDAPESLNQLGAVNLNLLRLSKLWCLGLSFPEWTLGWCYQHFLLLSCHQKETCTPAKSLCLIPESGTDTRGWAATWEMHLLAAWEKDTALCVPLPLAAPADCTEAFHSCEFDH